MNRKQFITNTTALLTGSLIGCKSYQPNLKTKNTQLSIDLHTHPGLFFMKGSDDFPGDQPFYDRIHDMKQNGLNAAFVSLVADWPLLKRTPTGILPQGRFEKNEGWETFMLQYNAVKAMLSAEQINVSLTSSDSEEFKIYLSSEGGDFLGGDIDLVNKAHDLGLRSIQLVHYAPNDLGDLQTWKADHGGLSAFGRDVVKRMNQLGMIIDVAHASARTVKNVVDLTTQPIMLSHSILQDGADRPVAARAISEDHAKMVASTGGVVGMWPSGFSKDLEEFIDYTFKMIDVIGIDHVGIGTDMDANFKPVIRDYHEFSLWRQALMNRGLSQEEMYKVAGGNAQRVITAIL